MNITQIQSYVGVLGFGFLCSLVLSFLLTPAVMKLGFWLKMIDQPDERRIHTTPTPRCGGLAVFIAYSVSIFTVCFLLQFDYLTPATRHLTPDTRHPTPDTRYPIPDTRYP